MAAFVDRVVVHATAGKGGNGCASVRREKFKPLGGPDGANGGRGGSIIIEADTQATTLLEFHRRPHLSAENGAPGAGDMRQGRIGADLIVPVPPGTVVMTQDGEVLADLVAPGTQFVAAQGGAGGLGNAALASPRRKAPGFALLGEPGEDASLVLELKSVADVALVGFPSAGKSSLIAAISAARPKIADYPFTTLVPNLGVVEAGDSRYTVADVPGLIPGASEGKGLGLEVLRHIERCAVVVHVLDCATLDPGRDPISDLDAIEAELAMYSQSVEGVPLTERPSLVALAKIDVPEGRDLAELVTPLLEERGHEVFALSAVSHEGLRPFTFRLAQLVAEARAGEDRAPAPRIVIRPAAVDEVPFTITARTGPEGPFYQVRGTKPERWVHQTDFTNDEAVGYLADRLQTIGVEEQLFRIGAHPGDTVVIGPEEGGVIFDWEPTMMTGAELLGPRGVDARLEEPTRRTTGERRREYRERMDGKAEARAELWSERDSGHWTDPGEDE